MADLDLVCVSYGSSKEAQRRVNAARGLLDEVTREQTTGPAPIRGTAYQEFLLGAERYFLGEDDGLDVPACWTAMTVTSGKFDYQLLGDLYGSGNCGARVAELLGPHRRNITRSDGLLDIYDTLGSLDATHTDVLAIAQLVEPLAASHVAASVRLYALSQAAALVRLFGADPYALAMVERLSARVVGPITMTVEVDTAVGLVQRSVSAMLRGRITVLGTV